MKRILMLVIIAASILMSQTARPVNPGTLRQYQWILTSLTACVSSACYPQANGANDTADMYLGTQLGPTTNGGVVSAGSVTVYGAITLTFTDGNNVSWPVSAFSATASGNTIYPLGALFGMYFAKGLRVTCAGAGCAAAQLQVYYQR